MRLFTSLVTLVSLSTISFASFSYSPTELLPYGARASLIVADESHTFIEQDSKQFFAPASTLKVVTALAAKLELGDDYRFETQIERIGSELVIRFSGDPTLSNAHLDSLLKTIKQKGISKVSNVYLDNSAFSGYERAVGWPWDILGVCYSAPASAITLDRNCVQASISSAKSGQTKTFVPVHQPITVTSDAKSLSSIDKKAQQCDLELTTQSGNQYHLSGCMSHRSKPLPLKFAVQDTVDYTQHVLSRLLKENRIELTGKILTKSVPNQGLTLASHQSEPLSSLLDTMLKRSDNLIADNLTKTLGREFFFQAGSFANGTQAIKQIIFANTGINLEHAKFADGSGLSRNNRMTTDDMQQVLRYIWQHDKELNLIASLPISGESGTLKYRKSMRSSPIKGQIQAKSGSVYGSYNMAGYILDQQHNPTAMFVQFVADYHPVKKDSDKKGESPNVLAPIYQFEQQFYADAIKLGQESDSPH